jgi:hypothetical protein
MDERSAFTVEDTTLAVAPDVAHLTLARSRFVACSQGAARCLITPIHSPR